MRPYQERFDYVREFLDEEVAPHLGRFDPERHSALGQDFGRSADLTVLVAGQETQSLSVVVPLIVELKNMPIEQQYQVISFIVDGLPKFLAAKFDATGNGLGLAERCQERYGFETVEAVKLSQTYYLTHAPRVRQHYQDQSISHARDADIKDDMRVVKLVNGIPSIPNTRNKGRHGDSFVAMMLFLAALKTDAVAYEYRPVSQTPDPENGNDWLRQPTIGNGNWPGQPLGAKIRGGM